MDAARWERLQTLFHAAATLEDGRQLAYLQAECGGDGVLIADVMSMLEEDAEGQSLLDGDRTHLASRMLATPASMLESNTFGPYHIVRLLGEGGSGVVYLAEREDLQNQVAIKFLRDAWLSPARRARFAGEQRTLAQLNHPSIARLYDAGAQDDGTPWFVMEYVEGLPLMEYCERHVLSIEDRLRLFRAVCQAVAYAHQRGIIHRDLKPSNVLVKADGAVRLLDFGIAKQRRNAAAGNDPTQTGLRLMTPAYASPEQIRGEGANEGSDIYSLGVTLYQLIAGCLPFDLSTLTPGEALTWVTAQDPVKPSVAARRRTADEATEVARARGRGSWTDLDVLCLTAMHKDPSRRYPTVDALVGDVDRFLNGEPLAAHGDSFWYGVTKFSRRQRTRIAVVVALLASVTAAWNVGRRTGAEPAGAASSPQLRRTVAVLPFRNVGGDASLDFLRQALPDEIATILSHIRSVSVRPFATAGQYGQPNLDPQKAGREMRASTVVTGHFMRNGEMMRISLEAIDVETNQALWQDILDVPAANLVATQAQIGLRVRGGLATTLGWPASDATAPPTNEEAYGLFLRSTALTLDPVSNGPAIEMLEHSVELDATYAPAWVALARRYYVESRYGTGATATLARYEAGMERALSLDPNYIAAASGLILSRTERGDLSAAYKQATDLVRRRPDSIDAHFGLSYVLRFAGKLDEAALHCETAFLLDPRTLTSGLRSCASVFILRGEYARAMNYADLDHGSDFAKAMSILSLVRQGKEVEAVALGSPNMPAWNSYDLLLACADHRPAADIQSLAAAVRRSEDPETNYFSAAHLAYCGQAERAVALLKESVRGKFCGYPAIDSDPYFASVRSRPDFLATRAEAMACHQEFLANRGAGVP